MTKLTKNQGKNNGPNGKKSMESSEAEFPTSAGHKAKDRHKRKGKNESQKPIGQEMKKETAHFVKITQEMKKDDVKNVARSKASPDSAGKTSKKPNPEKKPSKKAQKRANNNKEEPQDTLAKHGGDMTQKQRNKASAEEKRRAKQLKRSQADTRKAAMVQKGKKAEQQKKQELEAQVAALEQKTKELKDREEAAIKQSRDFYQLEMEATNNRLARKLASQKRKADAREAKEARAAVKLQRRKNRHQLRQDAKPEILKPVFSGVGKKKGHKKSQTRSKSNHATPGNGQDDGNSEDREEEEARAEAQIADEYEGENHTEAPADEEAQGRNVTRETPTISEPPTLNSNDPEAGEDLSSFSPTKHAVARAYIEERKSLALKIKETIQKLKTLSARDVFIEVRLSDMRVSK